MKTPVLILFILSSIGGLKAQSLQGLVFEDLNQNGYWDKNEPYLNQVRISDGYDVATTAPKGSFNIQVQPESRFLSITTPSGYKPLLKHYITIDPNIGQYLFPLIKDNRQSTDKTRLLQITDSETSNRGPWVDNLKNYAVNQSVSFLLHTGDICYEPGLQMHADKINSTEMGLPTYYTVGNHDLVKGQYGERMFEDLFGPTYYSFESGPVHMVVTPMLHGDHAPRYTKDQVIRWLKKDLALKDPKKPLVFVNHNYIADADFVLKGESESIDLKNYNLKAWLYGHWHNNYIYQHHGVYVICSAPPHRGGIDNAAGQFLSIELNTDGVSNIRPIYSNLTQHLELISPSHSTKNPTQKEKLIDVVAYDSERQIISVDATALVDNSQQISTQLSPQGDWHWKGSLDTKQAIHSLNIMVKYNDGKILSRNYPMPTSSGTITKLWSTTLDAAVWRSKPLISKDKIYFGAMDDGFGKPLGVYALNKESGKVIWYSPTTNSIKNELQLINNTLLATDVEGNAYALNAENGKTIWDNKVSHPTIPAFVSGPTVDQQYYYTGTGTTYRKIAIAKGETQWTSTGTQGGEASPAAMSLYKDQLFVGVNWNALYALNKNNGEVLWKNNDRALIFRSAAVSFAKDTLYAVGSGSIYKFNPADGQVYHKKETEDNLNVMGAPLILDHLLILGTGTGGVKAYDRGSLTEKWQFQTENALVYTSPYTGPEQSPRIATVEPSILQHKGRLYVGASDGHLYILSLAGELLQKINFGAPIFADPVIVNDRLYVADFSGTVTCFKL
ncbi:outer membrane protein assembly factor BamB family protein [Sphingobacterium tabacisoli]|uniref:PQQ-binding-like beta-propeller repeat protein n=1 Tax=Sphingobacterium tabacisoli TaxID=2044855 RepID=A0ABW5KYL9_9SPHI|nr:PQQ-binding-like beta-propeller repeat protein [Sphingobacterium tabacisoli]